MSLRQTTGTGSRPPALSRHRFPSAWLQGRRLHAYQQALQVFNRWADQDEAWREQGKVDRAAWREAGNLGLLCRALPVELGGQGGDFGDEAALVLAQGHAGQSSFGGWQHSAVVAQLIWRHGSDSQKKRWLPKLASGEWVGALAITEAGAGSDMRNIATRATLEAHSWRLDGEKAYVANGQHADLILVLARTREGLGGNTLSLIGVEAHACVGFERIRNLDTLGLEGQDTSQLRLAQAQCDAGNLLGGQEGQAFQQISDILIQERLLISLMGVATMDLAFHQTVDHAKSRKTFGAALIRNQHIRFQLAEAQASLMAAHAMVDAAVESHLQGQLTAERAAAIKFWVTDQQCRLIDDCLQLHGGKGYMRHSPIARLYADARVQRIYGGANEVMKELAARQL